MIMISDIFWGSPTIDICAELHLRLFEFSTQDKLLLITALNYTYAPLNSLYALCYTRADFKAIVCTQNNLHYHADEYPLTK